MHHSVISTSRVRDSSSKSLGQTHLIVCKETTSLVGVKLSEGNFLLQADLLAVSIFDRDLVGFVATGPNDDVCVFKVFCLL